VTARGRSDPRDPRDLRDLRNLRNLRGLRDLRFELRPMLSLAGPVVLAELGWITMGIVDTLMVGRLSAEAIGAVGIGSNVFFAFAVFGMGLLLGLDTLVSHAFGARRLDECHRWLVHGIALSLALTIPLSLIILAIVGTMPAWGLDRRVLPPAREYLSVVLWSVLPLLLYASFRRYLQAMNAVRPVMVALTTANLINAAVNWILIFGKLGAPTMGVRGAAWATVAARTYMALFLLVTIVYRESRAGSTSLPPSLDASADRRSLGGGGQARPLDRLFDTPLGVDLSRVGRLLALGLPAATQVTLEVGVFAGATALAGKLAPAPLAAHQISLNLAGFTFMIPFGVASAGAVRVGQAVGRIDPDGAARAGWTAFALGVGFMVAAAAAFLAVPRPLLQAFTADQDVVAVGVRVLMVAAFFQIFDGVQGVATGVLRGLGDTRTPMLWNLAGHWVVGLPLGYALCFNFGWGVTGLWTGLLVGLTMVGVMLMAVWWRQIHALPARLAAASRG
jgi:MATE family multidrug resistance protein